VVATASKEGTAGTASAGADSSRLLVREDTEDLVLRMTLIAVRCSVERRTATSSASRSQLSRAFLARAAVTDRVVHMERAVDMVAVLHTTIDNSQRKSRRKRM
jgi:hypothetical protein